MHGFPLKKPPDSYTGTDADWKSLTQSQRKRIRKGPAIRERERAYRNRPDVAADIKEYRLRPEVKAAAYATYLRGKERKRQAELMQTAGEVNATHVGVLEAIVVGEDVTASGVDETTHVVVEARVVTNVEMK